MVKELLFSDDFINDLIDNNKVMQSTWQTGAANARLEFSGEARFQIIISGQKWLLGSIKI